MANKNNNLYWHQSSISVDDRRELNKYKSCVIWFTGLSAAGKSTLANALNEKFHSMHIHGYVLDGDNIRHGLNKDLGFKPEDRKENIRRIGEVAKLLVDAGLIAITAFISPYREDRHQARELVRDDEFLEVYVKCDLAECERRDPKGIYKKARKGEIKEFTGISAPYEEPEKPEIVVDTTRNSIEECTQKLLDYLIGNGYIEERLINGC
ncbi:MAG: adenylyl-sulfate kinase [Acidobacteria bacterium]|nr:adenylyl-sulfate kinase [Acidobacteriota bacterium]